MLLGLCLVRQPQVPIEVRVEACFAQQHALYLRRAEHDVRRLRDELSQQVRRVEDARL